MWSTCQGGSTRSWKVANVNGQGKRDVLEKQGGAKNEKGAGGGKKKSVSEKKNTETPIFRAHSNKRGAKCDKEKPGRQERGCPTLKEKKKGWFKCQLGGETKQ